jgi:hypothetical protein
VVWCGVVWCGVVWCGEWGVRLLLGFFWLLPADPIAFAKCILFELESTGSCPATASEANPEFPFFYFQSMEGCSSPRVREYRGAQVI